MRLLRLAAVSILSVGFLGCGQETSPPAGSAGDSPEPAPGAQAEATTPASTDTCRLTMGWDPWEPYHYLDPAGEERGLDVELVSAIAADADCDVVFERDSWANLLKRVADGDVDLISGATKTPEREAYARFSESYRQEAFVLFTQTGAAGKFPGSTIEAKLDAGMRIGLTDGYLYGGTVESLRDSPDYAQQFVSADIGETNVTRLMNGEIDAFLEDRFVAAAVVRRRGLEDQVTADLVANSSDVRLMFSKASVDPELVDRFNASMERLRTGGEFGNIQSRYLR